MVTMELDQVDVDRAGGKVALKAVRGGLGEPAKHEENTGHGEGAGQGEHAEYKPAERKPDASREAPESSARPEPAEPTAGALVGLAMDGDETAWEEIVATHARYLGSIGRAKRLTPEECSDAVQETWLSAVAHLPKLRDPSRLRPWLAMIMRRSCEDINLRRTKQREDLVGDVADLVGEWLRDERVDIERDVLATERTSVLHQALRMLPEGERVLLTELARNDGSYGEIARHLGIPVGSIGPTRMRALRRLRELVDRTPTEEVLRAAA